MIGEKISRFQRLYLLTSSWDYAFISVLNKWCASWKKPTLFTVTSIKHCKNWNLKRCFRRTKWWLFYSALQKSSRSIEEYLFLNHYSNVGSRSKTKDKVCECLGCIVGNLVKQRWGFAKEVVSTRINQYLSLRTRCMLNYAGTVYIKLSCAYKRLNLRYSRQSKETSAV